VWLFFVCPSVAAVIVAFAAAALLGRTAARYSDMAADLFAAAALGSAGPVRGLIGRQVLAAPGRYRAMLVAAGVPYDMEGPLAPDGERTAKLLSAHLGEGRARPPGWGFCRLLRDWAHPAERLGALGAEGEDRWPWVRLALRPLTLLGNLLGAPTAVPQGFLPAYERLRGPVLLGAIAGVLLAAGALLSSGTGPGGYLSVVLLTCALGAMAGWGEGHVLLQERARPLVASVCVLVTALVLALAYMALAGLLAADTPMPLLGQAPVVWGLGTVCVCAGALVAMRARRS